ncbi:unnamed protein product [Leptidea sinapis]|uniref:Uncharacterized protein n=1 Tax=Leptidea sinapis TaxID=189913 RepID=A0A5E4R867_9NEOP|nr:unnamed protein product [Leptidea sinapis]
MILLFVSLKTTVCGVIPYLSYLFQFVQHCWEKG